MRDWTVLILLILLAPTVQAQDSTGYQKLLNSTTELDYADSLHFSMLRSDTTQLDSLTVKKYFSPLLTTGANKFKNKTYSLLGKVCTNKYYDLIVLLEEKNRKDSTGISVVYLVTMKKSGDYISSMKAAVSGTKKKSGYNITSHLYNQNRIYQDSRITTNNQPFNEVNYYRISSTGRFILSEKDN